MNPINKGTKTNFILKKKKLSPLTMGQNCSLLKFEAQITIQIF